MNIHESNTVMNLSDNTNMDSAFSKKQALTQKAITRLKLERRLEKKRLRELTDTLYGDWD